jgi:hypothetical protein
LISLDELQTGLVIWEELQASSIFAFFVDLSYGRDTALEECGDGFQCGYHVGWFRVVRGGAACTLVLVYVSIRLSESQ